MILSVMTDLSPAAQAVLDAVASQLEGGWISPEFIPYEARKIAAAICAAADQVVPDEPHPELSQFWDDEADREWQNNQQIRRQLLAIAAELEDKQ